MLLSHNKKGCVSIKQTFIAIKTLDGTELKKEKTIKYLFLFDVYFVSLHPRKAFIITRALAA